MGWARPNVRSDTELGADELAYVFNGNKVSQFTYSSSLQSKPYHCQVINCVNFIKTKHIAEGRDGSLMTGNTDVSLLII